MSISGVANSSAASSYGGVQNPFAQRRSDFKQLASALSGGDLSSAQQAFKALQSDLQGQTGGVAANSGSSSSTSNNKSQLSDGLAAIGQALQSGDLSGAQKAFASFVQQAGAGRHRHHHHDSDTNPTQAANPSATPAGDSGGSSRVDTTA